MILIFTAFFFNHIQGLLWPSSHQPHVVGAQGPPAHDDITGRSHDSAERGRAREKDETGDWQWHSSEQRERAGDGQRRQQRLSSHFSQRPSLMKPSTTRDVC